MRIRKPLKEVKHRLIDLEMTTAGLADNIGVSRTFMSAIVNGSYIANQNHWKLMAEALDCRVKDIFPE